MLLSILCLVTVTICGGIRVNQAGNFPINGCSTDEIDFLFLYYDAGDTELSRFQKYVAYTFFNEVTGSDKTTQRLLFADVYDSFSATNITVNVSSWRFNELLKMEPDITKGHRSKNNYNENLNKTIEVKIRFVKRLFSEMAGVRENVTHIAAIVLDGFSLSFEETRSIPHIVQQQVTDIKIFVVVFCVTYVRHIVYLRDTILLGCYSAISTRIFMMAICNQCTEGWFSFQRTNHVDSLSCYFLSHSTEKTHAYTARKTCLDYDSDLATIETKEEITFLKTHLAEIFKYKGYMSFVNETSQLTAQLFIGLRKDFGKYFHWSQYMLDQTSPLVVNHWLPRKPAGGSMRECGVWQFVWNVTRDDVTNLQINSRDVADGWEDVGCEDELSSLSLCEVVLPPRVEDMNVMRVKPASNERFSHALTKGNYKLYRDNIVSVSANIASRDFLEFLHQIKQDTFPLFDCGVGIPDPRYISYIYVCDTIDHCSNKRDELFCDFKSQAVNKYGKFVKKCHDVNCCDGSCLPLQRVGDGQVDCNVCGYSNEIEVNDESEHVVRSLNRNETCALFCNDDDSCVHLSQLNDTHTDCTGPEGPLDETIGKLETADTCYNILGHRIWAPMCVYVRDRYGVVLGCRDMAHLKDCVDFECREGYFKCPDTYCIPQHYVLDGTVDCPSGEEESNYNIGPCTGSYSCWNSKMCLHPDLVCNGHPDCPHQDDEADCHVPCLEGLRCVSGTVTISDHKKLISLDSLHKIGNISRYLNLSGCDLSQSHFEFLYYLYNVRVIIFSHCNISDLYNYVYHDMRRVYELDLSNNLIKTLDGMAKLDNTRLLNVSYNKDIHEINNLQLRFLETLDLSHTSMSQLEESFFVRLPSLKHLNLSFTKISNIDKNAVRSRHILQTLDLRGLSLKDFYENYFNGLTISQDLYTDSFELCCPQIRGADILYHTCHTTTDAISSCSDLIESKVQRVLLWAVAVLAVLGNFVVIVYRLFLDRFVFKTGYGLFVTNLGISDFIMGVYLFIIAGADYYYRDIYVLSDKTWREGYVCRFAGFLATLSSETSTFFIFLITVDRFLVIKFPFGQIKLNEITKIIILLLSWTIGFLLALTPVVFRFEIYSSNSMCLGLPLTTERFVGWEFSFGVFIVLNLCLFLLIVYGQRAIFSAMSENRMTPIATRRAEDITVAKQLSLVALSNFLCWFPVGLIGILCLSGHVISNDVYAWTTVIVLPINSAANPLLYTIPALMAKWERFKYGATRTIQTSP